MVHTCRSLKNGSPSCVRPPLRRDEQRHDRLEITVRALDIQGEVIIPSMTFIATAHALQWQGITPVFCDVDAESFTLTPIASKS